MPSLASLFGLVLITLGMIAYSNPTLLGSGKDGSEAVAGANTSLTPAIFGGILLLTGLVSLAAPKVRKHAMHLAAAASLLGAIGGVVPVVMRKFAFEEAAVKVGLGMSILSVLFLILCINSFIAARKARKATDAVV